MKDRIDIKHLYLVLFVMLCFIVSFFFAMVITPWLFIVAVLFGIASAILERKYLRCPKCGTSQSMLSLLHAVNHSYFCYACGEEIRIKRDEKAD